ncbi:MAG: hypothetical protein COC10_04355 [Sphingobium sp.]|nr:MAG: hypothetical protein COC10_04355 [Sphingobium sp.]
MRMSGLALALVPASALVPAIAAAQGAPSTAQPAQSVQQMFDAAAKATGEGDHASAAALLATLEQRVTNPRSLAIVRLRRGMALGELRRWKAARPLLEQAIAALPMDDRTLDVDRGQALRALGKLELFDLDYEAAYGYYARALRVAVDPAERIATLLGKAQAGTFLDAEKALADADEAARLFVGPLSGDKTGAGYAESTRGQALLNQGRFAEAEQAFAKTVAAEGGLSRKVNYQDLVARSDASIAAMLAGHRDKAREYLLYTGAGRMEKQDFTFGADMALPICGEEGIEADDMAVVEFGINDDGTVSYARPIYGSRPGAMALVFARAVRDWSWLPEDVAKIPGLFRLATRLELRCSTSAGGPSLADGARAAFRDWGEQHGIAQYEPAGQSEAQRRAALAAELTRLRANPSSPTLAQAMLLSDLLENPLVTGKTAEDYRASLRSLIDAAGAPPQVRLWADWLSRKQGREELNASAYAADPAAHALALLLNYDRPQRRYKRRDPAILDSILSDAGLPDDHPLRVAALIRRASARAAAKDFEGARADYRATGLTEQQCSIVDAEPAIRSAPVSGQDYPTDMVRMGIEGWTRVQHDVSPTGQVLNSRVIAAYPPIVFSANGAKIISRARFEQSYRPGGAMGCSGSMSNVTFRMPS